MYLDKIFVDNVCWKILITKTVIYNVNLDKRLMCFMNISIFSTKTAFLIKVLDNLV